MALYVEEWPYKYKSYGGIVKTKALNLWKLEDGLITKIGEYIYWPFASEDEPNFWADTKSVIRHAVKKDGKLYKSDSCYNHGWVLEPLENYSDAKSSFEEKGIVKLE